MFWWLQLVCCIFPKGNEMRSILLCPFRGNRLNIMFFNGGHVYFLHKQMIQHLNSQPGLNKLLKSVQKDLGTPLYIAGCKALGLISIFLTTTLWKLIGSKDVLILEMAKYVQDLLCYCTENLGEFIRGQLFPFNDSSYVRKDAVYESLVAPSVKWWWRGDYIGWAVVLPHSWLASERNTF